MNTKKISLILVILGITVSSSAEAKFHALLDYTYSIGLIEHGSFASYSISDGYMYGNTLSLSGVYAITPQVALGLGVGLDNYDLINTFPVFLVVHYAPIKKVSPLYLFGNIGYSVKIADFINSGWMVDAGMGYKLMFKKHFGLNFRLGYNWKRIVGDFINMTLNMQNMTMTEEVLPFVQHRHSMTFGVGFIF